MSEKKYYRPELNAVRFIAFLSVFFHHTLTAEHTIMARFCSFGLPLFFALSAFLIGELLLQEKDRFSHINLRKFYIRRCLRIWPLYFFGLLIGCLIAVFIDHRPFEVKALGVFAFMLGNVAMVKWGGLLNPMGLLWSISIEEQFYLFCPLAIRTLNRKGLGVLSGLLILVSDTLLLYHRHSPRWVFHDAWFSSFVQFQMFGAGLILCLCLHGKGVSRKTWLVLPSLVFWGIASLVMPQFDGFGLVIAYTCIALGCVGLIRGIMGSSWPQWVIYLGKISYGLYVYHVLSLKIVSFIPQTLLRIIAAFALTVLMAAVSYRFLETPFLKLKREYELIKTGT